jgi:hypothetical protein
MKAPLSKDIAKVLRNERNASDLVSQAIRSRSSNSGVVVTIGGTQKVYRPAGSLERKK